MNVLFLSIAYPKKGNTNLYSDLANELVNSGHQVTVVTAEESRSAKATSLEVENNIERLRVRVGNQFGVGLIEKGITTLKTTPYLKRAIKKFLNDKQYDLILYSTPPVTFAGVVEFCKTKFKAKSYLMLKDIFPQNAVDLELIKKNSIIYKYFKKQELDLYNSADKIGCMSNANIQFIDKSFSGKYYDKLDLFFNSKKITPYSKINKEFIRTKYNLPLDKVIFVFGGNLGKPQGIDFLISGIKESLKIEEAHFLIVGSGAETNIIEDYHSDSASINLTFIEKLPSDDYQQLMKSCDVGLIVLNHKFTIPNIPSRVLSYMHEQLPIFAATDQSTDIGKIIQNDAKCGWWSESNSATDFAKKIKEIINEKDNFDSIGINGRDYLEKEYDVRASVIKLEEFMRGE